MKIQAIKSYNYTQIDYVIILEQALRYQIMKTRNPLYIYIQPHMQT